MTKLSCAKMLSALLPPQLVTSRKKKQELKQSNIKDLIMQLANQHFRSYVRASIMKQNQLQLTKDLYKIAFSSTLNTSKNRV